MRKIPNILGKYKTVAGAFFIAFLFAVPNVREVFAAVPDFSNYGAQGNVFLTVVSGTGNATVAYPAHNGATAYFGMYTASDCDYGSFTFLVTNSGTYGGSAFAFNLDWGAEDGYGGQTVYACLSASDPRFGASTIYDSWAITLPSSGAGISAINGYVNPDTNTRFTSISPNATTTATSTVLNQQGYVNSSDLASTTVVVVQYNNNSCSATGGFVIQAVNGSCSFSVSYPVISSGSFNFSTTTVFSSLGQWNYVASIENVSSGFCLFGYCPFSSTSDLSQLSGSFIVGTSTGYDNLVNYIASTSQAAVSAATLASTTVACNPFSGQFSVVSCVTLLLVPNGQQMSVFVSSYSGAFLSYFPLGYVTRLTEIIASSSPAEPPGISYTFGSSSPAVLQGLNYSINPFDYMGSTSPLNGAVSDDGQSRTIWQIVDPYFTMVTAFAVFGVILSDVLGVEISRERKKGRVNKRSSDDDY